MNLFIVEDSVLIQNRLIRFVEEVPGIHVIGVSGDVESALERVINTDTDAIILDIQLGEGNGLQLLKNIKQKNLK